MLVRKKCDLILDYKIIRTQHLKFIRDNHIQGSVLLTNNKGKLTFKYFNNKGKFDTRIRTHIIDTAIKLA